MDLTAADRQIIGECLTASADGPFFPDCEFQTLFGLEREQVRYVARSWPNAMDTDMQNLAVNNSLANLLGYPHGQDSALRASVSVDEARLRQVFDRWRARGDDYRD